MTPYLLVLNLVLSSSCERATAAAAQFRQNQLEEAVLANDVVAGANALHLGADPDGTFTLTPARLVELNVRSHRLLYYFEGEAKATPLILAASLGEDGICAALLDHGAKRYLSSQWGWVAAQYAARMEHSELAQRLMEADPRCAHFNIVVDLGSQEVVLYKDGIPIVTGNISTGKPGYDTPPGHYLVTDKIRLQRSTIYKVKMPYFLRLSFSEYGIHLGVNPGRPASHGCIRIGRESVARRMFETTPIGTPVTIE